MYGWKHANGHDTIMLSPDDHDYYNSRPTYCICVYMYICNVCIYVCICIYVCMYICNVCIYVCICIYVCVYVCMYKYAYVMHVYMYSYTVCFIYYMYKCCLFLCCDILYESCVIINLFILLLFYSSSVANKHQSEQMMPMQSS